MPLAWREYAVLLFAVVLWGTNHTAGKLALRDLTGGQVALIRPLSACAFLLVVVLLTGRSQVVRRELRASWRVLLLLGLTGYAFSGGMTVLALQYLPAGITSLLSNVHPLMLAVAAPLFGQPMSRLAVVGAAIGLAGVGVLSAGSTTSVTNPDTVPIGVGLALVSSASWAAYTVLARRIAGSDPVATTALASGVGAVLIGLVAVPTQDWSLLADAPTSSTLAAIWTGSVSMGITYTCWSYALRRLPAQAVAPFGYLVPVTAVAYANVILGEPITLALLLGAVLVLAGVALSQRAAVAPKSVR